MKKLLLSFFTPLLVSLFLFPNIVKADTYDISISQTDINYINNFNWSDRITLYNSYSSQNNLPYYIVSMVGSGGGTVNDHYIYYFSDIPTIEYRWEQVGWITPIVRGTYIRCIINFSNSTSCDSSSSSTLYLAFQWTNNETSFRTNWGNKNILYTNFDIPYTLNNRIVNINNGDYIYTFDIGNNFIGLYNLINYTPPSPPDSTPLLTQFFNISIEKLQLICDFFTSSYVYLSIFVIFILYFVILLLRRLK